MEFADDFRTLNLADWDVYDSEGHDGQGERSPSQVGIVNSVLSITGLPDGTTGGMKLRGHSQRYGQWDICLRTPRGPSCYHPVVMLWGGARESDVDNPLGEIDIVEVWQRPDRDRNSFSVHYGEGSEFVGSDVVVDMTDWHWYHLVWDPAYLYTWIDDNPAYFSTTDVGVLPPGEMDLTIQLDWFPEEGPSGPASMQVAGVRQYARPLS